MKKISTLLAALFLMCVLAVTSFAAGEVKILKNFGEDSTEVFYQYRDSIVEVNFVDSVNVPKEAAGSWNVGEVPGMGVTAWMELNANATAVAAANRYNLYIGADGGLYTNSNMSYYFKDFTKLEKIGGFENLSTETLTNLTGIFSGCSSLKTIDFSLWNTSKVITMSRMFNQCHSLEVLDLSAFNTESLTSMHYMFADCEYLKTILVGDGWKLREDVTGLNTFLNCKELSGNIDYDENKVSSLYANVYGYMTFKKENGDEPEAKPDAKLDKTIKAYGLADETDFHAYRDDIVTVTFEDNALSLVGGVKTWDVSTKKDGSVQASIKVNNAETIKDFYGNAVAYKYDLVIAADGGVNANPDSSYMFYGYKNLKSVNGLENLKTSNTVDMKYMFYGCDSLEHIDISSFDAKNVKSISNMFGFCYKLRKADLSSLDTSNVTDISNLFYYCTSLEEVDLSGMNLTGIEAATVIFVDCPVKKIKADGIILNDKTIGIFKNTYNGRIVLEEISLAGADLNNVTDMSRMFEDCDNLTYIDLSTLDLSKIKNMSYMFNNCGNLETVLFGETNALSVADMSYMFKGCRNLKVADFSGVSIGSIKNMAYMFYNCFNIESLNFGKFNTALLQNLDYTFNNCSSLRRIYVGNKWSIQAVASGNGTFENCEMLVGSVSYAVVRDVTYKAATLNGYLTPVDETVKIPPVEEKEENNNDISEVGTGVFSFFQRIIQWFRNIFQRYFGNIGAK